MSDPIRTYQVTAQVADQTIEATLRELTVGELKRVLVVGDHGLLELVLVSVTRNGRAIDVDDLYEREVSGLLNARRDFLRGPAPKRGT